MEKRLEQQEPNIGGGQGPVEAGHDWLQFVIECKRHLRDTVCRYRVFSQLHG